MAIFYDILLDENGDLPKITRHTRGWLAVVQRVKFRLQTFQGEWVLDTAVGLPYLTWRGQKVVNLGEIGARIQAEVLATPGVIRLLSFEGQFFLEQQRVKFSMSLEVEDIQEGTAQVALNFFPFGDSMANTNPIALYVAPSKTVL